MAAASGYLRFLPPVLWSTADGADGFDLGSMLCAFEKVLTGIADGVPVTAGDGAVLTTVIQDVAGSPAPQPVLVQPGTGPRLRPGSSYTLDGPVPEVISVLAVSANTVTATIRRDHRKGQAISNASGVYPDIQSVIAGTVGLYGAWTTPPEFFDWLAQWVALQSSPAWDDYTRRTVLSQIVGIYADRGTRSGLTRFFDVYAVARQRPRVVIDDARKLVFCQPQAGQFAPVPVLVSQRPLVAPQCLAITPGGYLLVGDLGSSDSTVKPGLWRISPSGAYDYAAGPPAQPQPFVAPSAGVRINSPAAVAADRVNGGAYLIDLITSYVLYRFTAPQTGTVTLSGTPVAGGTATIVIGGTAYPLAQTAGAALDAQATALAAALNASASFSSAYTASASGPVLSVVPQSGEPSGDLTYAAAANGTAATGLQLTAAGPAFASGALFTPGTAPPLGVVFPRGMAVNAAGHPLILDRGALPGSKPDVPLPLPSQTAVVDVQVTGSPPAYTGVSRHPVAVTEPLSLLLRADGSLVIGDGGAQGSTAPADLVAVNTTTWTATSLLRGLPASRNPLVAPVGIVEAGPGHLHVLDAGLRPYIPSPVNPFIAVIARQAAIYDVDLTVSPPAVTRVSELGAAVYPRGMVGDGHGTLYACDSGLPDITGYSSRLWRSGAQQMSVVVQFQGDPTRSVFCLTLSGTPAGGQSWTLNLGAASFPLAGSAGATQVQQAAAWAQALNATAAFRAAYMAAAVGNLVCLYPAPGTDASGVDMTVSPPAPPPGFTVTAGRLAVTVTLGGTPTTGESAVITIGGVTYSLPQTTGQSLTQQAVTWAATLNSNPQFNQWYTATAAGPVLSVGYLSRDAFDYAVIRVTPSAHLSLTPYTPPLAVGRVALSGTPVSGEPAQLTLGDDAPYQLLAASGLTADQQAAAWTSALNGQTTFARSYLAVNAGNTICLFSTEGVIDTRIALAAVSTAHLFLQVSSEYQDRSEFLHSISDVLADEFPAQARWYVQSELSHL